MHAPYDESSLGAAELQQLLSGVDPSVILVAPRPLAQIIKRHRRLGGVGLHPPHRKTYVLGRDELLAIVSRADLGLAPTAEAPAQPILLACDEAWLADHSRGQALLHFWRLFFHARLDRELAQLRDTGKFDRARVRQLVAHLGPVAIEEALRVLRQENFLFPHSDEVADFCEFVAVFLELYHFARPLLADYFPAFSDLEAVEETLCEVIDADLLLQTTRLSGVAEVITQTTHPDEPAEEELETSVGPSGMPSAPACQALVTRAEAAAARGNVVWAGILRIRAADVALPDQIEPTRQAARADLDRLAERLQRALELDADTTERWRAALLTLLGPASRGMWPASARLLYDLQKVCVDSERELYALDLVEWFCSLGKKAVKRLVPLQAQALLVKHLRSAAQRLARVRITREQRSELSSLLHAAIHQREERLRATIHPILDGVLREVGFAPRTRLETLALSKIVEELLDRVIERGFINMGDLRDAVARNQLKLPDAHPGTVLLGDWLIKANRKLAIALDGVYQRGEIYLRWFHRFSALLFGNFLGRWLTLFILLPFGGALATAIFLQEMVHLGGIHVDIKRAKKADALEKTLETALESDDTHSEHAKHHALHWSIPLRAALISLGALGVFYLLLMHLRWFRRVVWCGTKAMGRLLRAVFWELPGALLRWRPLRAVLDSPPVLFLRRFLLRPAVVGLAAWLAWLPFSKAGSIDDWLVATTGFVVSLGVLTTPVLRRAEEALTDWVLRNWYWLRVDVIPGLIGWTLWLFREILDRLERVIYTVDQWLRFRPGESALALVYKPLLGLVWFLITYLLRVLINLFIEPTVNPIKHFPAVTVGAKLIIPLIPVWSIAMTDALAPFLGVAVAGTIAGTAIVLIPGIFGFAVWEFKENWKLYRANRPTQLKPVMIGSHGETMTRFLRPGFHSGTLPKTFSKLRQARRRGHDRKAHKQLETLHHAEQSLHHFVDRELIAILRQSRSWGGLDVSVGHIRLATNCVAVELRCPSLHQPALRLAFEERGGWLQGRVAERGWLDRLAHAQRCTFEVALAGVYKLAGVTLVYEQLAARAHGQFRVDAQRRLVFLGDNGTEEVWSLDAPGAANDELFHHTPLSWADWERAWENDATGVVPSLSWLDKARLLPAPPLEPSTANQPVTDVDGE